MSKYVKLRRGYNINLAGEAQKQLGPEQKPELFAVKPTDFFGLGKQKVLVGEGDRVEAGTPLYFSKEAPQIQVTSPVSGQVVEVERGAKRKLLAFKIKPDAEIAYKPFDAYSISDIANLDAEKAKSQMLESGVWPNLIQRPFGIVARPQDTPKHIFISGFDSAPLAPDYGMLYKGEEDHFKAGLKILQKLTSGYVHLNINSKAEVPNLFARTEGVQVNKFEGKHPAGNVGVQIHHISPISSGDVVWTTSVHGVIQIGRLFLQGRYDATKLFAFTGSEANSPQYYKTINGAQLSPFLADQKIGGNTRIVSGNVLTGQKVPHDGFLGFYDQMVTALPEGNQTHFLGWMLPQFKRLSFQRAFGLFSFLNGGSKQYKLDTNMNGEERAFVQTGVYEKVLPMDILPLQLFKAIMAEDFENMEALGILEIIEEDVALCEFIDVSKLDLQNLVREGIETLRNS